MSDTNARSQEYSRLKERLALVGTAMSLAGSTLFLGTGLATKMNRRLLPRTKASFAKRLRYQGSLSLGSLLLGLPLSFYSGYIVEKRFGLSNQTPGSWAVDVVKGEAISAPLQVALVEGTQWVIRRWPERWWLIASGTAIPLTAGLAFLFPVLIAPRFNTYEPLDDKELAGRLKMLAEKTGIRVADVIQMDMSRRTTKANAFFAGIGNTKRIVVSDTMLAGFTPDEIEAVVAHEIGHQVNRDLWRFIFSSSLVTLAITWATDRVARSAMSSRPELAGTTSLGNPRALPVIAFVFGAAGTLITPLQLAYSRRIERRTDRFAVELTGNGAAYAGAMEKLAALNLADPNPPGWVTILLHSHPPIAERIDTARSAEVNALWT